MINDIKTSFMIMQLESAAMQVFNQYAVAVSDLIPSEAINLRTLLHKRPEGNRKNPTVADILRIEIECDAERRFGKRPEVTIDQKDVRRAWDHNDMNSYRRLIAQRDEELNALRDWMKRTDLCITIEGYGYRMSFPKYEVFDKLEKIVHASDYPTSKLLKYAIA